MSKSKEELDALKKEVETVNRKLHELTEEELEKIHGGAFGPDRWEALCPDCNYSIASGEASLPPFVIRCPRCDRMVAPNIVYYD